ncbi:SDR family oxidoreductase [Wenjunlia tyrosinilytica]|uniref:Short-chain dehydrogenase n=1 Tax=Wenjunlia tyrosinilytica TaxID=1544741 RepID=A0A917ZN87_9ACTN|nr:SDR family oxidoreductase [Wenjunlia tyrosinilytica]GGO86840.1 short-chain dehydrogenase [Wenjunlia tyrosinilytica]
MTAEGRVVAITGAGRGIGREHALAFARAGAKVVVNDLGDAACDVVTEIRDTGGQAAASADDIGTWAGAKAVVDAAVEAFGRLDVLVNNAGILRDRMLVSMEEDDWDAVVRVHLKGHFATLRHAAAHWRARAKAGERVDARVVNTGSGAGLLGSVGQGNYAAAKAGITALTQVAAVEMARYGVTVNAIAPAARTRMTEQAMPGTVAAPATGFDHYHPGNVSPLVVWLASPEAREVTGRVFEVEGGRISVATGWRHGPHADAGRRWAPEELGPVVATLLAEAPVPEPPYGSSPAGER